jgi:hypothetical protein
VVPGDSDRPNPWAAEDIIIVSELNLFIDDNLETRLTHDSPQLSDGLCSSACALFLEMMHHEAGVRVVAVGGRPSYGPMQAPAGSRGAAVYSTSDLDSNIEFAQMVNAATLNVLPNRTEDLLVSYASINLRDQIRRNKTNMPLQFMYDAADCRIFYTPNTWYNYTNLWKYAADAIWKNSALCVKGSTAADLSKPDGPPPNRQHNNNSTIPSVSGSPGEFNPILEPSEILDSAVNIKPFAGRPCKDDKDCNGGGQFSCKSVTTCDNNGNIDNANQCVPSCSSIQDCGNGNCQFTQEQNGSRGRSFRTGFCIPYSSQRCGTGAPQRNSRLPPPPPV